MNAFIETLNRFGEEALHFAWPMLWQSSALIVILFAVDFALRRRVRAAVRYALWLVLLVKLLLPPSLALPTGIAWWLMPATASAKPHTTKFVVSYDANALPSLPLQPAPAFTPPPRPPMSVAAWTILAWSAISAGLLVWLTVRWRQVMRDVKRAMPVPAWLNKLFDEAKSSTGLHRNMHLRLTDQAMSPAVCGLFRPVILLPQSLVQKLPPLQLRAVLLHELTHLQRGDVWMNCAQALAQIVYWWHPLLWLANARIRRVREEAVDDAVMLALRDDAEAYAPTLIAVAKLAFHRPLASLGLVGIMESRSALRQRIERLVNFRAPRKSSLTFVSLCGICLFSAAALPMAEAPTSSNNQPDFQAPPSRFQTLISKTNPEVFIGNAQASANVSTNIETNFRERLEAIIVRVNENPATNFGKAEVAPDMRRNAPPPIYEGIAYEAASNASISDNLYTRTFKVDTKLFLAALQKQTGLQTNVTAAMRQLLSNVGVDLSPPKSIFYNDRMGVLFVHATEQDLDAVEKVVQVLNDTPPPQIHIKARFIEVPQSAAADLYLGSINPSVIHPDDIPLRVREIINRPNVVAGSNEPTALTGIMTASQFQTVRFALQSNPYTEPLAEPEATITSGRQVQMRATVIYTMITNFALKQISTNLAIAPQQSQVELGPVLDAVACILPDGCTIDLKVTASAMEFLGYDNKTNTVPTVASTGAIIAVPTIHPNFRVQQSSAHLKLWDGQTVVLGKLPQHFYDNGKELSAEPDYFRTAKRTNGQPDTEKKELLVFITVTLVDPAGNRIHSDEEVAQKQHSALNSP